MKKCVKICVMLIKMLKNVFEVSYQTPPIVSSQTQKSLFPALHAEFKARPPKEELYVRLFFTRTRSKRWSEKKN